MNLQSVLVSHLLLSLPLLTIATHSTEQNISSKHIPWRQIKFISAQQWLSHSEWRHNVMPTFSAKGMDHLYMLTEWALNYIQPQSGLPLSIITDRLLDDPLPTLHQNKALLLSHFWGIILTSAIFICIAVIMPLIGFLCCCCRSRSSNGAKRHTTSPARRSSNKKRYKVESRCDPCFRSLFGVTLFTLLLLISFCVICAFVTNEYISSGVRNLPKTVNQSADDIMLYLKNTQLEVNTLLRTNFKQLESELFDSLDRSGLIVKNRLALLSQASALENLTDIVTKLDSILMDLRVLSGETQELRLLTLQLQEKLSRSKNDLEVFFLQCRHQICVDLSHRYNRIMNSFSVSTRIDDFPDLNPLMKNISKLLSANIVKEINKGKQAFDELSLKIQSTVNNIIPDIKDQIRNVGIELGFAADDINEALSRPNVDLHKIKDNARIGAQYISEYEDYRWYGGVACALLLLVILLCYTFGLTSGVCNEQPTRHNYKRHSKSSSRFFKCGIHLVFLLLTPLILLTVVLFVFGSVSDKVFCYYIENPSRPQSRQIVSILQNRFEQMNYDSSLNVIQGVKPNFADVLSRCHLNLSLYNVLELNRYNNIQISNSRIIDNVNITDILALKNRFGIENRLDSFLNRIDVNPSNIIILTSEGYQLLESLNRTSLGTLNFSSYANVIKNSITPLDLETIASELELEAARLPKSEFENVAKLRNIAMDLNASINIVINIKNHIAKLTEGAEKIEKKANYGDKGLNEALTSLLREAEEAQQFMARKGHSEIRNVAKSFVDDMSSLVDQYAKHAVDEIENNIGKCEPVSRAVNASVMSLCKEIVYPFNGFWSSMGSSLLLCIPATLCAFILSRLYKKVKRSSVRRNSSNSMLDTLDEDDIPLAHVDSKNNINVPTPSAPIETNDWSPGAAAPHLYGSRPPPYNFAH